MGYDDDFIFYVYADETTPAIKVEFGYGFDPDEDDDNELQDWAVYWNGDEIEDDLPFKRIPVCLRIVVRPYTFKLLPF
jgi:hypothetical protein